VVGAGFAGLLAAWCLKKRGVQVVVLEASNRVGGRVHSLPRFAHGRVIEGGAELIGSNHPAWLLLAHHFGLGLSVITPEDDFEGAGLQMPLTLKGRQLSPEVASTVYDHMTAAFRTLVPHARTIKNPLRPWEAPKASRWDNRSVADWIKQLT